MPADQPSPQPSHVRTGKPPIYTFVSLGLGIAGTALMLGLIASDQADKVAAVLGTWAFWIPIAILSGTRRLWDPSFEAGGTRLQRIRAFLAAWVGYIGVLTAAVLILVWAVFRTDAIHPRTGWWLVPEIAVPVAMLFFGGAVRKIGVGILIALAAPLWPYLAVGGVVILGPAALVYLLTVAVSNVIVSGQRKAAARSQGSEAA